MANRGRRPMPVQVFLLGDKMLDRLRNATLAMLGLVTAVGLVLVALVLQQGWPSVFGGPLPGLSNKPPADEIATAVPGVPAGGAAPTLQSRVDAAPLRTGSPSGDRGDASGPGKSHDVAGSAPVASSPVPPPSEGSPEPPPAPPPAAAAPPAPAPTAVAPPSTAQAGPVGSAKAGEEDGDSVVTGVEGKKSRGKDKVTANGPTRSVSKPSRSKPQPSSVDKASAEPAPDKAAPPAYAPDEDETETLPVEEKGGQGSGRGHGKDD